jgi:competence protein ComEC
MMRMDWGGTTVNVVGPPPDRLFEESNDNSGVTLLTFGSARILLAGDAGSKEEEYMSNGSRTGPYRGHRLRLQNRLIYGFVPC